VPDIFDNLKTESRIGPALMTALTNFDTRDVATGYFDLRGWSSFADIVEAKWASSQTIDPPAVRVLVGMVMPADSALFSLLPTVRTSTIWARPSRRRNNSSNICEHN
jgi:hypothetical protein